MVLSSGSLNLGKRIISKQFIFLKESEELCVSLHRWVVRLLVLFVLQDVQGFNRNLKSHEIIAQVLIAQTYLKKKDKRISNVVFMGMGEPLLNESAVYDACEAFIR